ncbi:MAG: response regulator transcription factor [Desulfitobacteriaceae bacterium]
MVTINKIRVLVADDHEIVRLGLIHLLEQYPDLEGVDEGATSLTEVLSKTEQHRPDVVIMDVRLKGSSGIDACREVCNRFPQIKVIMLTSYGDEETVMESIFAGAKGYILKDVGNDELIRAVQAVYRGESLLDPVITKKLLDRMRYNKQNDDEAFEHLTDQEKKVLICITEGKTNREIAETIFLSEKTVRNYVSSILGKLHLSNRTEAAAFATKKNLFRDE